LKHLKEARAACDQFRPGRPIMKLRHVAALTILLVAGNAFALTGKQYLSQASVQPAQARDLALKTYPGKIVSEELEQESGGSGLRYSFVIRHRKAKHEVGIDAKTGKVLENSIEGANPD
jgi:peptidase YpeB-like protein